MTPAEPHSPTPADFLSYIVTPSEDLNPYDLSTMQKSTETNKSNRTGTLGKTVDHSGIIEIKQVLQKKEKRDRKPLRRLKQSQL